MPFDELRRPVQAAMTQPGDCKCAGTMVLQHRLDGTLVLLRTTGGKRQRNRTQIKLEQPIAQSRLVVVVTLRLRLGDDGDLSLVETKPLIDRAQLRLGGLRIGQKDAAGAAFDDRWSDARALHVG